jgi:hypothetical protein
VFGEGDKSPSTHRKKALELEPPETQLSPPLHTWMAISFTFVSHKGLFRDSPNILPLKGNQFQR